MVSPDQRPEYYIRQPIVPPMGETRDFGDVACDLAERMGMPLGFKTKEEFVRLSCEMTPEVKEAGGFEYMKEHGVYHNPETKAACFSYMRTIPPSAFAAEDVIFDEWLGVYWNWKKSRAKSREEAMEKGLHAHQEGLHGLCRSADRRRGVSWLPARQGEQDRVHGTLFRTDGREGLQPAAQLLSEPRAPEDGRGRVDLDHLQGQRPVAFAYPELQVVDRDLPHQPGLD
ncbi:hypothetical protein ACFOHS_11255 [Jhaorihella thermophila]